MAGTPTTNYGLPTYADGDAPNLGGAYNTAMQKIDTQMKSNETGISSNAANISAMNTTVTGHTSSINTLNEKVASLESGSFAPSDSDKTLTVAQLSAAKVTSAGIVYFKSN